MRNLCDPSHKRTRKLSSVFIGGTWKHGNQCKQAEGSVKLNGIGCIYFSEPVPKMSSAMIKLSHLFLSGVPVNKIDFTASCLELNLLSHMETFCSASIVLNALFLYDLGSHTGSHTRNCGHIQSRCTSVSHSRSSCSPTVPSQSGVSTEFHAETNQAGR